MTKPCVLLFGTNGKVKYFEHKPQQQYFKSLVGGTATDAVRLCSHVVLVAPVSRYIQYIYANITVSVSYIFLMYIFNNEGHRFTNHTSSVSPWRHLCSLRMVERIIVVCCKCNRVMSDYFVQGNQDFSQPIKSNIKIHSFRQFMTKSVISPKKACLKKTF